MLKRALGGDFKLTELPSNKEKYCKAFADYAPPYSVARNIQEHDTLIVVARSFVSDSEGKCDFLPLREAGIEAQRDIQVWLAGYTTEEASMTAMNNDVVAKDIEDVIKSRERFLRIPVGQVVRYHDANGKRLTVAHSQVIRVDIVRKAQPDEGTKPDDGVFHLHWDFTFRKPTAWSGFRFPTLIGYTISGKTWRTLPVATATGLRVGTSAEVPHYVDLLVYVAPAFRVGGGSRTTTTAVAGIQVDFGGFFGVGIGLDIDSGKPAKALVSASIGATLRGLATQ